MTAPRRTSGDERVELRVESISCAESVRSDQELLRTGRPIVRVAVLGDRALSVGVNVPENAPYLVRARAAGIPIVRRSSGGTAVIHDRGDLAFSIVLPRSDPRVGRDFVRAYARLGAGVARWYGDHGVEARWGAPPGLLEAYCLLGPRGQVLRAGGQVVSGAAQHLTGTALLHHGAVPARVDRVLLAALFRSASPGPLDSLGGFAEVGITGPAPMLAQELGRAIAAGLGSPESG